MAKFLYVLTDEKGEDRIWVKNEKFAYPDGTHFYPLKQFSTADLLKVKAQIATELETRMDYDDVVEANLEKLRTTIRTAKGDVVALLVLQTMDRIAQVANDEKRAKTRLSILQDEMKYRFEHDGESKKEFEGIITATYDSKTVYSVGEEGWDPVYAYIVSDVVSNQIDKDTIENIAAKLLRSEPVSMVQTSISDRLDDVREALSTEQMISSDDMSVQFELLDRIEQSLEDVEVDTASIVDEVVDEVIESIEGGLKNSEAFEFLQKRLKTTTLDELSKQGEELPKGIQANLVREVKFRRNKK